MRFYMKSKSEISMGVRGIWTSLPYSIASGPGPEIHEEYVLQESLQEAVWILTWDTGLLADGLD
jgi:hypothetical protein